MSELLGEGAALGLLVLAGVFAGWVNTLAGGGSLLTVPALMWYGLPADVANGTSRVAIVAQCLAAVVGFRRQDKLDTALLTGVAVPSVIGALAGAYAATRIPNRIFEPLLLGTLLLMAGTMLLRARFLAPEPEEQARDPRARPIGWLALLAAGLYGGLLQAGVGLVLLAVLAGLLRLDLVRANALKVSIVLLYSVASVLIFATHARVSWPSGLTLALGNVVGALLGVRFAVRKGQQALRKVMFVVVVGVIVSLFFK